jgi:hypothetical protein
VEEAFDGGKILAADGRTEDFGFFTKPMRERDFEERCAKLGDAVLSRIRLG